jgi:hypothetical protein
MRRADTSPMRVSGIAILLRSVATRSAAPCARPMPPPIVTPSINATTGFGNV